jgi:tRNA(fMet)-specific endonuclease VapC
VFLLDTNIISDVIRYPHGRVATRIQHVGLDRVCTSIVVAAELRYGAERRQSPRLAERVDAVLERMRILALEVPADRLYADLRAQLERNGELIGPNDLLIAAHAMMLRCTLVTDNEREFERVPDLLIENWLH